MPSELDNCIIDKLNIGSGHNALFVYWPLHPITERFETGFPKQLHFGQEFLLVLTTFS